MIAKASRKITKLRKPSFKPSKSTPKLTEPSSPPTDNVNITLKSIHEALAQKTSESNNNGHGSKAENTNLVRKLSALANKLSESNIEPTVFEIEQLYTLYPKPTVTQYLSNQILISVSDQVHLLDTFVMTYAALLVRTGTLVGQDILASFVQSIVSRWLVLIRSNNPSQQREALNISILIGHLYNFRIIACTLVYDLIRELCINVNEGRVELILRLFKLCGLQLRHDDPASLIDMHVLLTEAVETHITTAISFRLRFMLETVGDLTHGKTAKHIFFSVTDQSLYNLVMDKCRHHPELNCLEPLRPSLDDIRYINERGTWWVCNKATITPNHQLNGTGANDQISSKEPNLLKLARRHGMNTDIRRAIFATIMSSDDYLDAHERLLKLGFSEMQDREIVRVIVHCCGVEVKFNLYYAVLLHHLCSTKYAHKITTQYTIWDFLNSDTALSELSTAKKSKYTRQLDHMAQLLIYLIRTGAVALSVLRVLDPTRLSAHQVRFLRLFVPLLQHASTQFSAHSSMSNQDTKFDLLDSSKDMKNAHKSVVPDSGSLSRVAAELERNLERYATVD